MIKGYRSNSLNQFWMNIVLIQLIGSVLVAMLISQSWGMILGNSIFWGYTAYANRQKKAGIFLASLGWSLNLYLLTQMPLSFSSSLLMNMFLLTYISYLHFGSLQLTMQENHIGAIGLEEIIAILILTPLFLIVGSYINAVSMIFAHNYVQDALTGIGDNLFFGILVLAIAPAIVEELAYRGFIFQRLGSGWKTVLMSAALFAFRHMNLNQICYAFVMGILLAMVYQISGNLVCSISIHMLFNLYSVLLYGRCTFVEKMAEIQFGGYYIFSGLVVNEQGAIQSSLILVGGIACVIALALILLFFFCWRNRQLAVRKNPVMEAKENWIPDYLFFLGCILCMVAGVMLK